MLQYLYQQPRLVRFLASYLCIHFIFFGVLVQPLYAITSGPTQPEVQSFQPMGASDMVDIFSGDFSYNIPMFELPGPNGGYPFNLSYHGGVSMDEEASWIGLGWNLNVGAITRSVRGLPDEFNGSILTNPDKIIKYIDMASQTSYEVSGTKSVSTQIAFTTKAKPEEKKPEETKNYGGRGKLSTTYSLSYSNSAGFNRTNTGGADFAANYTIGIGKNNRSMTFGPSYGKSKSFSTVGGATNTDTYGLDFSINKKGTSDGIAKSGSISLGVTYSESVNSRTGLTRTLGTNLSYNRHKLITKQLQQASINSSFTLERAGQSYPPSMDYKRGGANYSANFHIGKSFNVNVPLPAPLIPLGIGFGTSLGQDLAISVNTDKLATNRIEMKPYGYLYSHFMKTGAQDDALMDVNREKDAPVKKETKYIGVPNLTYDNYSLSGQGIGGSFRAFRSDIGFSCDNHVVNTSDGGGGGAGYDIPAKTNKKATNDVSLDLNYNHNVTTTKKFDEGNPLDGIKNGTNNLLFRAPKLLQKNKTQGLELDETVYFKLFGENTTQTPSEFEKIGTNFPWHPKITNGLILDNKINIGASTSNVSRLNETKPKREHRNTYIQPILNSDVVTSMGTSPNNATVLREYQITYVQETRPVTTPQPVLQDKLLVRGNTNLPAHHIGGFTVTSSDGTRYIYALPVYNIKQVERTYSIQSPVNKYDQLKTVPNQVATIGNTEEAFNSATETSRYPYAYMLTAVLGADYVDAGAVGPSVEDGGYWVKFTYQKTSENYKWRTPFKDAFYNKGLYVSREDDKASYSYGEKEIYYLYKAETQSHVALFETSKRVDGRGVENEDSDDLNAFNDTNLDSYQYKLDKAKLFTRFEYGTGITPSNLAKPIVSVNLKQDYSLCKKVDNNKNTLLPDTNPLSKDSGKLTLNSISFSYENSERGTLSPYQFDYGYNPNYDTHKYDRWGTFKEPKNIADYYDFPYTNQEPTYARDKYAGAWCLSTINLPTGSTIKVTYEQDDYAFVQNKEAMQMYEIAGIGKIGNFNYVVNEKNPKIFFKLPANSGTTNLQAYLDQTRQVYYKGMFRLKEGVNSYELLSGWLDAASIENAGTIGTDRYASVTVKPVDGYHPFALGAWQHMKTVQPSIIYRYDVDKKLNIQLEDFFSLITNEPNINPNLTKEATEGYNGMCASNYWGNEMAKGKGWIRLNNVVGKKYGGGDRVKRILITDNWQIKTGNEDAVYGQVYEYTMQDTEDVTKIISSGVATYEPSIGGEENALKYADKQTDKIVSADDNHYFFEGPINETLYPGPSVGYQQVKVQSLVAAYLSKNPAVADLDTYFKGIEKFSSSGEVMHEFYTAKDYPTISSASEITIGQGPFPNPIDPKDKFQKNYYMMAGQGFVIESNDMHGKPKAVTYYGQITTGTEKGKIQRQNPVSWVRYIYKNTTRNFKGKDILVPNSTVDVLLNDPKLNNPKAAMATIESRNMGLYYDIFADARMYANESYNYSVGFKMGIGLNDSPITLAPSINLAPPYNGSSEELRILAFNKVIHRNGILERTQAFDGGATVTTTNHIWGENGEVLVSSVDNNFNDRIYTYNIPAHFVYDLTGFAFYSQGLEPTISLSYNNVTQRYRATLIHRTSNNIPNASLFSIGDEFIIKGRQNSNGTTSPIGGQSQKLIVLKKEDKFTFMPSGNGTVTTILEFEGPASLSSTLAPTTPIDLATLVYRSGKRNLLAAKVGHITVLVENGTRNNRSELEIITDVLFKRSKPEHCNMGFTLTGCVPNN